MGKDRWMRSYEANKHRRAVQRAKQQHRWEVEADRRHMSIPVFHANRRRRYIERHGIDPDLHRGEIAAAARVRRLQIERDRVRRLRRERDEAYEKAAHRFGISGERTKSWGDSEPEE